MIQFLSLTPLALWLFVAQQPVSSDESLRLQLQALNEVLREEATKMNGLCNDATVVDRIKSPDHRGAQRAQETAALQRLRVHRMLRHSQITRSESVAAGLKGAEYLLTAFSCKPADISTLTLAQEMIGDARIEIGKNEDNSISADSDRHQELKHATERAKALKKDVANAPANAPPPIDNTTTTTTPPPPTRALERFSARLEAGYSAGRLSRSESHTKATHSGFFLQASIQARHPFRRWTILYGPYYSYWKAKDRTSDVRLDDANVHDVGGRVEAAVNIWKENVTFHPALEFGLEFGDFKKNLPHPDDPGYESRMYRDFAGLTGGGVLTLCGFSGTFCAGLRLRSVPGELSVPTTQIGVGLDVPRLINWVRRSRQ